MLWLFAQVWVWLLAAVLLGVLAGWWFLARPLRREIAERAATAPHSTSTA